MCHPCGVERLPLADPRVREELRAEAERRLQKRMYGEYFGLSLLGFVLTLPVILVFGEVPWVLSALGLAWFNTRAYALLRKRSALGLYAERQRRLRRELASPAERLRLPPPERPSGEDPESLDLDHVLSWLDAKIE
jgi:hypothetical protein